jgi:HSP20 family protein
MRRNQDFFPARDDRERGLSRGGDDFGTFGGAFTGSPWQMMRRMQEDMDRLFGHIFTGESGSGGTWGGSPLAQAKQVWAPSVDISHTDREWSIEADLPGVNRDDIDVQVQNGYLILTAELRQEQETPQGQTPGQGQTQGQTQGQGQGQGQRQYHRRERRYGYFQRVVPLPENADEENISCDFRNGVLTIHVPKARTEQTRGRRIPIGEAAGAGGRLGTGTTGTTGTTGRSTAGAGRTNAYEEEGALAGAKGGERAEAGSKGGATPAGGEGGSSAGQPAGESGRGSSRSRSSGK